MSHKVLMKALSFALGLGLSASVAQAGPVNDVLGQLGLNGTLTTLNGALSPSGPLGSQLAGTPLGNPSDLLGVTVLENDNRGNSPRGIGSSVGSGNNTGNGGLAGVGVLAGKNAGNGGQIGVGVLSEGNNGAGEAISLQLLNADTAIALALGGTEVIPAQANPGGQPILDPLSGGSASEQLRTLLGASGPIIGPIKDGLLGLRDQLGAIPATAQGSPIFGQIPALPGLEGSGPITVALLGGQNSAAQMIAAGVITGPYTGNTGADGILGASAISSGSSGNGGDIGVGAITGSGSGNGQVAGVAALAGGNSNSGNGGTASVGILSGNNSGTGATAANVGVLNGNNSANGGVINAGVLNGNNTGNNGTANVGALNGSGSANNGTTNVAVLNGPNSGQGGVINGGVLNPPNTGGAQPAPSAEAMAACGEESDEERRNATVEPASNASPAVKTAFNKKLADKRNCEELIKAKKKAEQSTTTAEAAPAADAAPAQ